MDHMNNYTIYQFIKKEDPNTDIPYEEFMDMSLPEIMDTVWRTYVDNDRYKGALIRTVISAIINS